MLMDERCTLDGMEIKFLRSMCDVTRNYRWKNEEVRHRIGVRKRMCDTADRKVLKQFGRSELTNLYILNKRVYDSEVEGRRDSGRGGHRSTSKERRSRFCSSSQNGAALLLPLPFSKRSGAPAPAPHKQERRSSCRSFIVLDVYKKTNIILLLQAQQFKCKISKCWSFVTKDGGCIDTLQFKLGVSVFKCED